MIPPGKRTGQFLIAGQKVVFENLPPDLRRYLNVVLAHYRTHPLRDPGVVLRFDGETLKARLNGSARKTLLSDMEIPARLSPGLKYYGGVEPLLHAALRSLGVHPIHAVALHCRGAAVLICGPSGAGKTTTAMRLVSLGWTLLHDDDSYLVRRGPEVRVWATRSPLYVTQDGLRRYRTVYSGRQGKRLFRGGEWKREIGLPSAPGRGRSYPLRFILFPKIIPGKATRLEPMDRKEAFLSLLRQRSRGELGMMRDELSVSAACDLFAGTGAQARSAGIFWGRDPGQGALLLERFLGGVSPEISIKPVFSSDSRKRPASSAAAFSGSPKRSDRSRIKPEISRGDAQASQRKRPVLLRVK